MPLTTRFKNRLRKLGVRYVMQQSGKVRAGDLGLMITVSGARRWQKVAAFLVGQPIKPLTVQIKRPLDNC